MRKVKKIAIWSAIILGANYAGLHGYSIPQCLSWGAHKTGSALSWVGSIGNGKG